MLQHLFWNQGPTDGANMHLYKLPLCIQFDLHKHKNGKSMVWFSWDRIRTILQHLFWDQGPTHGANVHLYTSRQTAYKSLCPNTQRWEEHGFSWDPIRTILQHLFWDRGPTHGANMHLYKLPICKQIALPKHTKMRRAWMLMGSYSHYFAEFVLRPRAIPWG